MNFSEELPMNKSEILIYGAGGHGRSIADVILTNNPYAKLVFIDENAKDNEKIFDFDVVKDFPWKKKDSIIAIGDNVKRGKKYAEINEDCLIVVKSTKAYVGKDAQIKCGCFIGNYCHIGPEAVIAKGSIINTASVIEHEVHIGEFCHIGPHACVCGRVSLENYVFLGAGATVIDKIKICSHVIIGAGAVVVADINESGTYLGVPAKKRINSATPLL
jgi:UDP-N-acetylbacillosamine N-acetyltransferase